MDMEKNKVSSVILLRGFIKNFRKTRCNHDFLFSDAVRAKRSVAAAPMATTGRTFATGGGHAASAADIPSRHQTGSIPRYSEAIITVPVSISALSVPRQTLGLSQTQSLNNLPIAALIVGAPAVGGALFLIDKLIGDRVARFASVKYNVKGPWKH